MYSNDPKISTTIKVEQYNSFLSHKYKVLLHK